MKRLTQYADEIYRCMRCGACQAVCPVFAVIGQEGSVARGRIRLMREMLEGKLAPSPRLAKYVDLCLGCRLCVANCPPGVNTDRIMVAARHELAGYLPHARVKRLLLRQLLRNPRRFAAAMGVLKLARRARVNGLLPGALKLREDLMPALPAHTFRRGWSQGTAAIPLGDGRRIGFFLSCMGNQVFPQVARAAVRVLERQGLEVIIPDGVVCCGAAHHHSGDWQMAREMAWRNIMVFREAGVEAVITDCASCGSAMREYAGLFAGTDEAEEAAEFAAKVADISVFLVEKVDLLTGDGIPPVTVTYHDACHLIRYQGVKHAPRQLLSSIGGITFREMVEADRCCGGAGTYNLFNYQVSIGVLDRKIKHLKETGADLLATGCPACRMQLEYGIRRHGLDIKVVHPVELLALSLGLNTEPLA